MKQFLQYTLYVLLRVLISLIGRIPHRVLLFVRSGLTFVLQKLVGYRKNIIQKNVNNAFPNKTSKEIAQIITQYYSHLSDLMLETFQAFYLSKADLQSRFSYKNTDLLLPYLKKNQSVILMGSHYGNWEMGCLSFPLRVPVPTYTVYKPLSNTYLDQYLKNRRGQWGMNMVAMNQIGRVLIERKNQASAYIFVADQSPASTEQAIWKNFLHQETPFISGVEKIAIRTGYPVFYFAIQKQEIGHYTVTFSKLELPDTLIQKGVLTEAYLEKLENQILENPPQWLWSHNRWKRANLRFTKTP